MNDRFVLDTHALFFYLIDPNKLKSSAKEVFDQFDKGEVTLFVPWIVIAELFWLARKRASSMDFNAEFQKLQNQPQVVFAILIVDRSNH